MSESVIKVKYLDPRAKMPVKGTAFSACWDIHAIEDVLIRPYSIEKVRTGLAMEIPTGYRLAIYPRSGLASIGIGLANSVGVIDSDYRGEIKLPMICSNNTGHRIKSGERIAQCALEKLEDYRFVESKDNLSETERGTGGFGSTGNN
jgi:dUTP pyrophosphatase